MKTDWLTSVVGQRIWSARCQNRIDSSASRVELNFVDAEITLFLDSDTPIKATVVNDYNPKSEPGWSDEKFTVFKDGGHEDNTLIDHTFHKLWTAAVSTDNYNKDDWKRIATVLRNSGYSV